MNHQLKPSPRALAAALLPLTLSLCAAAPPKEGLEVRGAAGAEVYEVYTGGCGTTRYANRITTGRAHGQVSYRSTSGLSVTAEANVGVGKIVDSTIVQQDSSDTAPSPEGKIAHLNSLAVRIGFHGKYGGLEAGVMPLFHNTLNEFERSSLNVLPSARGWLGVPEIAYAWLDLFAGPSISSWPGMGVGLGHASERLRVEIGYSPQALISQAAFKIDGERWIGARLHIMPRAMSDVDAFTYGALVTFSTPIDLD